MNEVGLKIGGVPIARRSRQIIQLHAGQLYDQTNLCIPVEVVAGAESGPVLFVSSTIHGDEINGVEIVQRLSRHKELRHLRGTLLLIPIVNVFGFNTRTRYLPDRRDLNRCFPGAANGSLASQVAHTFMGEIVANSTHGIDLHTAAVNRTNFPQIRACLDHAETKDLALAFGAPVVINANIRDGSLRQSAYEKNIPMLLYEAGEALRISQSAVRVGVSGILSVMRQISMLPARPQKTEKRPLPRKRVGHQVARGSFWVRAPVSGIVRAKKGLGELISKGDLLALISDPSGRVQDRVVAKDEGIVVGMITMPLVNKGDAMYHIAFFSDASSVAERIENFELDDTEQMGSLGVLTSV